ncbi:MAG: hypothetical protein ONB05_09755 [candidate division KSB1 bacterium]|nr:hypothetical protein [candidate division KSB1 bacterium]
MAETVAAGMTAELYKTIITVVDERVKEIRVTRTDFDELKGAVRELAQAQARSEERVGRLEQAIEKLAQAQARTEERVERLEQAIEKLAQAQARTEERVEKLALAQARTEKVLTNLTRQVGRLSDAIGFSLEDLGQWLLPAYIEKTYGITGVKKCSSRFVKVDSEVVELNLYAEGKRNGETIVLLGETKNRIRRVDIKSFANRLRLLESVFHKPTFRFIFGYRAYPDVEELAREKGIEVICSYQLTREG